MGEASDDDDERRALAEKVQKLEDELARQRQLIETIFKHIPAIFYVKDLDSRYHYGSPYGFRLFGVEAEDAIGHTDAELFPPPLAERFMQSDRRVLRGEEMSAVSYDVPVRGHAHHFAGVRFPIPGPSGAPMAICGFAVDVTERIELEKKLEKLAITDALTGLANRRRFDEHLAAEAARASRSGEALTLVICDVDHFKAYNDRFGHLGGDACLVAVARAIGGVSKRAVDLAARYGGEEFALVLPGTNVEGARAIGDRLRAAIRALQIPHPDSAHGVVTASAGIATVRGSFAAVEIIELADRALYAAKDAGRDAQVGFFEERSRERLP